eukprot:1156526-Pelagomonas_calceolata.AAC.3
MRPKSRMTSRPSSERMRLPGCGSACRKPVSRSCASSQMCQGMAMLQLVVGKHAGGSQSPGPMCAPSTCSTLQHQDAEGVGQHAGGSQSPGPMCAPSTCSTLQHQDAEGVGQHAGGSHPPGDVCAP